MILSAKKTVKAATFYKEQLLLSKRYRHNKDVLNAILSDNQPYTLNEVDKMIEKFEKEKVN